MGLISRASVVVTAKLSKAIDQAEDPAETLDYSYERQLELLRNVKGGVAEVVTAKKRLQLQTSQLEQSIPTLEEQARQALAQGREDLAGRRSSASRSRRRSCRTWTRRSRSSRRSRRSWSPASSSCRPRSTPSARRRR